LRRLSIVVLDASKYLAEDSIIGKYLAVDLGGDCRFASRCKFDL
jgi:hypothetical protein